MFLTPVAAKIISKIYLEYIKRYLYLTCGSYLLPIWNHIISKFITILIVAQLSLQKYLSWSPNIKILATISSSSTKLTKSHGDINNNTQETQK